MATWTDANGQTQHVPETGTGADRLAMLRKLPDLMADLRATGQFVRTLKEMREKQDRIERA